MNDKQIENGIDNVVPKHNKLRLVYAIDDLGKAKSYIHVKQYEALRMFDTLKIMKSGIIRKENGWMKVDDIYKQLRKSYMKLSYPVFINTLNKLAGCIFADMQTGQGRKVLIPKKMLLLKQNLKHHKVDLPRTPKYLNPPLLVRLS